MKRTPQTLPDARLEAWLARHGYPSATLDPLAGDVSARRYLRATSGGRSAIVALYPPSIRAACRRFRDTGKLLAGAGVRVPAVIAGDCRRGWMLLEDLGTTTLYDERRRPWSELRPRLEQAVADAGRIAGLPPARAAALNPPLDRELLERELDQTWTTYLEPQRLTGDRRQAAALRAALAELCRRLSSPPAVPCHRDFMARNLIPAGDRLAVIDHQDLRLGPPHYDLASLLNDSLYPPVELVAGLIGPVARQPAYRRAVAQRALKAVGTFASFAARGNPRHLRLVPATLGRALAQLEQLPETTAAIGPVADRWRAVC